MIWFLGLVPLPANSPYWSDIGAEAVQGLGKGKGKD